MEEPTIFDTFIECPNLANLVILGSYLAHFEYENTLVDKELHSYYYITISDQLLSNFDINEENEKYFFCTIDFLLPYLQLPDNLNHFSLMFEKIINYALQ